MDGRAAAAFPVGSSTVVHMSPRQLPVGILFGIVLPLWGQLPLQPGWSAREALQHSERSDTVLRVPLPTAELERFTPEQDSAYVWALQQQLPPLARFQAALRTSAEIWLSLQEQRLPTPWQSALRNLRLEVNVLMPRGEELVQHWYNLQQAQALPSPLLPRTPGSTFAIPLAYLMRFLGLIEDVSPTVRYELSEVEQVQVLVYSAQAVLVATLFDGVQRPGRYSIAWNGRDEHGRSLPPGDYVIEVRMGNGHRFYKRVRLTLADIR